MARADPRAVVEEDREVRPDDRVQLVARRARDAGEDQSGREETDEEAAQRHLTWFYARHRRSDCSCRPSHAARRSKRSTSASTIRRADDGGVVVGQRPVGRLQREMDGDRLAALADLVAAIDVEDARLAQLGRTRLERRVDERSRLDVLGDDDSDVLAQRRERDHVVVEDALRNRRRQLVEIELEHTPRPVEQRGMKLPEPACRRRCRLAGMEERQHGAARAGTRDAASRREPRQRHAPPRSPRRRCRRPASAPRAGVSPLGR